MDKLPGIY